MSFRLNKFVSEKIKEKVESDWTLSEKLVVKQKQQEKQGLLSKAEADKLEHQKKIWDAVIAEAKKYSKEDDGKCCFVTPGNLKRCGKPVRKNSLFMCNYHDVQLDEKHPLYFLVSSEVNRLVTL